MANDSYPNNVLVREESRVLNILWIGIGGAAGSIARYLLDGAVSRLAGSAAFPFGTLAVNVVGSFLMGAVMQIGLARSR